MGNNLNFYREKPTHYAIDLVSKVHYGPHSQKRHVDPIGTQIRKLNGKEAYLHVTDLKEYENYPKGDFNEMYETNKANVEKLKA